VVCHAGVQRVAQPDHQTCRTIRAIHQGRLHRCAGDPDSGGSTDVQHHSLRHIFSNRHWKHKNYPKPGQRYRNPQPKQPTPGDPNDPKQPKPPALLPNEKYKKFLDDIADYLDGIFGG